MKRIACLVSVVIVALAVTQVAQQGLAQAPVVDHFTQQELLERALALKQTASAGNGSASTKLTDYPNHFTMIALRNKNGGAEVHEQFADIFGVLRGRATLITGGTVLEPKTSKPGEIQGTSLKDGSSLVLKKGDFVHIPAGVPHQLTLPKGGEFVYFVIKVKEK